MFLGDFVGTLEKCDFRENGPLKRGLDLSFVWCWRVELWAIINHDVGKHAGGFYGTHLENMRAYPPIKLLGISLKAK